MFKPSESIIPSSSNSFLKLCLPSFPFSKTFPCLYSGLKADPAEGLTFSSPSIFAFCLGTALFLNALKTPEALPITANVVKKCFEVKASVSNALAPSKGTVAAMP